MGWFDSLTSLGSKAFNTVETLGKKALNTANTVGSKVSSVAHSVMDNPAGQAFLLANPEIAGIATGALGALDTGLKVGKGISSMLKPLPKGEISNPPLKQAPTVPAPQPPMNGAPVRAVNPKPIRSYTGRAPSRGARTNVGRRRRVSRR
jgi:hypothetical protein